MGKHLLTGQEIRHAAKQRLKRHRESMAKQGYKTVSVFMGEPLRTELDLLSKSKDMTKYQALEHIFDIYRNTVYGAAVNNELLIKKVESPVIDNINVTSNGNDKSQDSKTNLDTSLITENIDVTSNSNDKEQNSKQHDLFDQDVSATEKLKEPDTIKSKQEDAAKIAKPHSDALTTNEDKQEDAEQNVVPDIKQYIADNNDIPSCHGVELTPEQRNTCITQVMTMFKKTADRMDYLNEKGITKANGQAWSKGTQVTNYIYNNLRGRKKK